ncbi:MAG: glycosyltransferase family 1 protein [Nitrospirae bacterium]|nr:MAG: glycosyltransferase family 1 protein [Nitrospirota bacterium]
MQKIPVLYLRQSRGGGGGADTVLLDTVSRLDPGRFQAIVGYIRKERDNISALTDKALSKGIRPLDLPGKTFIDLAQLRRLKELVRSRKIEIIHCNDQKSDVYGYLAGLLCPEVKLVSTIHGWISNRLRSRFYLMLDRMVLRRFDAVIVVSDDLRNKAIGYGMSKVHRIHNAVDTSFWVPSGHTEKNEMPRVGFVGRLSKEKGPLDFVRAAHRISQSLPNARFIVAGKGEEEDAMKRLIAALGFSDKFEFAGHLDESGLKSLYNTLDCLLMTSYTEGLPMTILEACAMRVPVVSTKVGGVAEIVQDGTNGFLSAAGDVETLAANAVRILTDGPLSVTLKNNGRKIVEENFSLTVNIEKLQAVYESVL